jgi:3',5'-cyclic AMP phosphodiesterase CpdA
VTLRRSCFASIVLSVLTLAPIARGDFRFIHSSDPHFNAKEGAGTNAQNDAERFKEISALNPQPKFIVQTGDIVEVGTVEEYAVFHKTVDANLDPKITLYNAPGNHDVRWNPIGKEGYVKGVGPLNQSWDYENIHFVTLDSTVLLQHWGHISQDQLDWLKADLDKVGTEKPVIIGFHHWIGRDTVQTDNEQAVDGPGRAVQRRAVAPGPRAQRHSVERQRRARDHAEGSVPGQLYGHRRHGRHDEAPPPRDRQAEEG